MARNSGCTTDSDVATIPFRKPGKFLSFLGWLQSHGLTVLPALVVVFAIGSLVNPRFLTYSNIVLNIVYQSAVLGVLVLAETLMLISNRFDLSLESVVGIAPAVAAYLVLPTATGGSGGGLNVYVAIVLLLVVGAVVGLINGLLVVKLGCNTFMITLAMLILLRGLAVGMTKGQMMYDLPRPLAYIGSGNIGPIPVSVVIVVVLYVAAGLFMRYHRLGKSIYAIGGNEEAARAGGVRVERLRLSLYILAGTLAALAGLMLSGRVASVLPNQGSGMIFSVFAAAVIGGVGLNGGRGKMLGAFLGCLLIGSVQNILVISGISSYWINAVYGGIIVGAVLLSKFTVRE